MCWAYILQNKETGRFYVGSTNNLERRLNQHKRSYTRTTRVLETTELVYKEEFDNIDKARLRERQIKLYKGAKYIKWLISGPVAQR